MLGLNLTSCFDIFKLYRAAFYSWRSSTQKENGRLFMLQQQEIKIKECFLEIIKKLCYVPGSRTFYVHMLRDYDMNVSIVRCRRIMNEMQLTPVNGRPPKNKAKKKEGTHCHLCAAEENLVCQDFYRGPRKVILTDITYLYINEFHRVIYLCVFYDCFTKEALGWAVRKDMKTDLVEEAYSMMKELHGAELRGVTVLMHSDQGSQYTSTTFKQLLTDDGFLQSMSERGNSQDNAPMESFFGRMKERILNLIATCQNFETAKRLIDGYMDTYNNVAYQYNLAGLTPTEFYQYTLTGIYPLAKYFGVDASELGTQKQLIDARIAAARKRNAAEREAYRIKREREQLILSCTPEDVVAQDRKLLLRKLSAQEKVKERTDEKITLIKTILEKTQAAAEFIRAATAEVLADLRNPLHWKMYPARAYVYDMNGMY